MATGFIFALAVVSGLHWLGARVASSRSAAQALDPNEAARRARSWG